MKKNFMLKRVLVATAVSAIILSMTAVAQDQNAGLVTPTDKIPVADIEQEVKFVTETGKITSITEKDGFTTIDITNDNMGMVFHVENAFVADQKTSTMKSIKDLKVGMEITAIITGKAPMTMSIPPQTPGAVGFIINGEGSVDVSTYNDELINAKNDLKLNISEDTVIVDSRGTKQIIKEEDLKGKDLAVLYTITTRSIPAQTNPEMVIVLQPEEEVAAPETDKQEDAVPISETVKVADVELRAECDKLGLKITWTGNDKPMTIEKDGVKAEIKIGDKNVKINGEAKVLVNAPKLEKGKTIIGSDFMEMLK